MHEHLKTVVITGGSKGIGAALAEAFYRQGFAVVICGRKDNGLAQRLGRGVFFVKADVTRRVQMQALMARAVKLTGGLDVLINCAGMSHWRALQDIEEKFLDEMLAVNVKGALWASQAALKFLPRTGCIINIASLAGKRGSANNSAYCAAKFALVGLTQAMAKELGPRGIRVNAVCPVYVITDGLLKALRARSSPAGGHNIQNYLKEFTLSQTALKRLPTAQDVARACLFLASEGASAVSGQSINVDCGVLPQ